MTIHMKKSDFSMIKRLYSPKKIVCIWWKHVLLIQYEFSKEVNMLQITQRKLKLLNCLCDIVIVYE